jgi:hypothetical protein
MDVREKPMEKETFTVSDKRSRVSVPSPEQTPSPPPKEKPTSSEETASMPVTLSSLIFSLATSALTHLGQEAHPGTHAVSVELPMAKQIIDLLSMLQEKTKGNLTDEEEGYLSQTLFALRMKFVELEKTRAPSF